MQMLTKNKLSYSTCQLPFIGAKVMAHDAIMCAIIKDEVTEEEAKLFLEAIDKYYGKAGKQFN